MNERTQKKSRSQKQPEKLGKRKTTKHLEPEVIASLGPNSAGYRDAAEILAPKIHSMFVNHLGVSAPDFIYDIDTLIYYMMEACPQYMADFMNSEFTQGYLAGFVLALADFDALQIEQAGEEDDDDAI